MAHLTEESNYEQLQNFLFFHMDQADGRKARINPSITKEDVWNILMGSAMEESIRVRSLAMKRAIKEFGSYYEEEK